MEKHNRKQSAGQILVIAVLVVSLVLLSTQLYIYEVGRALEETRSIQVNDFVFAVRLGSRYVVAGSLANISVGGDSSTLSANVEGWIFLIESLYQFGKPVLNFTLRNTSPYVNGTYLSWGTEGFGISTAYTDFNFSLQDGQVGVQLPYCVNVTTSLVVEAVYKTLQGNLKQINVTCNMLNEGNFALAENVTVLYKDPSAWLRADKQSSYSFVDYGNGTYSISFEADTLEENINVSTQVYDFRGIYVQANVTCTNIP